MAPKNRQWKSSTPAPRLLRVLVLGSTGSIGTQTLNVIRHLNTVHDAGLSPTRFEVVGLAAGRNADLLAEQAAATRCRAVAIADEQSAGRLAAHLEARQGPDTQSEARVLSGEDAAERLVQAVSADLVVAAMVGVAGLPATLAAVQAGTPVALANKETLVAAGALVVPAAKRSGARLLPVDSEHAAIWQALAAAGDCHGQGDEPDTHAPRHLCPPCACPGDVERVTLTASGGPFREWSADRIASATPAEALNHPTWSMGAKVTIDSASLTNKALELLEAHHLFGLPPEKLDAVVHPQSIVHSLVTFRDGSVIAQLDEPDMRSPIQRALTFPHRLPGNTPRLDLARVGSLTFEAPDLDRFPALTLAERAMRAGGTAGAVLNAANEAAVARFLSDNPRRAIRFGEIARLTAAAMDALPATPMHTLEDCLQADRAARAWVEGQ